MMSLLAAMVSAHATDQADIATGIKVLPLLMNKMSGDTTMAVVYNGEIDSSKRDAENIQQLVNAGMTIPGGGRLTAILVEAHELGKLSRAKIAFLTDGLNDHLADVSTATSAASILTISGDIDCVRAAKCIIGVATKPTTTIYFSKVAADAAKLEFSSDFLMVVKQP